MSKYLDLKIAFVIPVYRHNPDSVVCVIKEQYPKSIIILVDDGEKIVVEPSEDIDIVRHNSNLGLAQSLIDGYERALQKDVEFIVKVDADGEYPIYPVGKIINCLKENSNTSGAFVELKRSVSTNGVVDGFFHITFGIIEGLLLFRKRMYQHSPGLHVYKKQTLEKTLPKAKEVYGQTKQKWGLDLVFLQLANHEGEIISYTITNHNWKERRSWIKILKQIGAASRLLIFLKHYSVVNSIKINGTASMQNYTTSYVEN